MFLRKTVGCCAFKYVNKTFFDFFRTSGFDTPSPSSTNVLIASELFEDHKAKDLKLAIALTQKHQKEILVKWEEIHLQGLQGASDKDLAAVEILGIGSGLHWESLDADLGVHSLFCGIYGSKKWMAQLQAKREA
jgi:hypothetical protein